MAVMFIWPRVQDRVVPEFRLPRLQTTDEENGHSFEDLLKCSFVYRRSKGLQRRFISW